ncbi:MAG: hypothetical protein ACOY5B_18885 [Spirochaetota bacterium]
MRVFPLHLSLALTLITVAIYGNEPQKCKDEKLVSLVEENCTLVKKLTGNEEGCKGYQEILKVCSTQSLNDVQLKSLRESMEKANVMLKGASNEAKVMQQNQQNQLRDEFTESKKLCKNTSLNSALDNYVTYSKSYAIAIEYLKICRDERKDNSYSNELARQIQAGLRRIRFKEEKTPDLRPYIDQCKDADIQKAAEATLAELNVLKHRGVDPVSVAVGYIGLEEILFQLEKYTKTENLEKLNRMRERIIAVQEVYARKKLLDSK